MQNFLFGVVLLAMLSAFCIAVHRHKKFPVVLKKVTWYLTVIFIGQVAMFSVLWYKKQNEYLLYHAGFLLEAITLLLMYREIFKKYIEEKKQYVYRKIFIVLIMLFVVFAIVNALLWQSINTYPSNIRTVLSIMIIILNVLYIYKHTISEPVPRTGLELTNYQASRVSLFWITTGLLLFHSFALLRYGFVNILREELSKESYTNISNVNSVFAVLLYIFIAIGLLKAKGIIFIKNDNNKTNNG